MLVKYWMRKEVATMDVNGSLQDAIRLMREHPGRLICVLNNGKLAGVVSDSDIKRASASDATLLDVHELAYLITKIKVSEIMSKDPTTIPPTFTLEETAARLLMNDLSAAPVVDEEAGIVGTISQREIFLALTSLSGFPKRGVQLAFMLENRPGAIKEVTDVIRAHGARLASILTSSERAPEGFRHVYVRAYNVDRDKMASMVSQVKDRGKLLYLVDHRENRREEFLPEERQVRETRPKGASAGMATRTILLCVDFSENSTAARLRAVEYAKAFQAELLVLHVISARLLGYPSFEAGVACDLDELCRNIDQYAQEEVAQIAAKCREELEQVKTHVITGEVPVEIVRFAEKQGVDLIVMGTHGWTGFKHVILGSVAQHVVRTATCPVLTVRTTTGSGKS